MKLYYTPRSCSVAAHITARITQLPCSFVEITKEVRSGPAFRSVHPLGKVPALELDDGSVLTELGAILVYLADQDPRRALLPVEPRQRARCLEWVFFVVAELHPTISRCFHPERDVADADA